MARTIEQIKRDIVALEQACQVLATEISNAYASYLTALGQATRQQTVLATYHLCTQGYPEAFLKLSFNQRQKLQQDVRKVLRAAIEQLVQLSAFDAEHSEGKHTSVEIKLESSPTPSLSSEGTPVIAEIPPLEHRLRIGPSVEAISSNPTALSQWQQGTEQAIALHLKSVSHDINRLLQQIGILPEKLPFALIEAALDSPELPTDSATAGPPNLLNLLVEAESTPDSEEASVTTLVAVYLRLGEIEFADVTVRAGRNQIRQLETRLRSLTREYHKKEREQAIAEAEAAWRASWFDD